MFAGKSLLFTGRLQDLGRIVGLDKLQPRPKHAKPLLRTRVRVESDQPRAKMERSEEGGSRPSGQRRLPLAEVVSDCVKRWFQDTLKEAKAGDAAMQVLIGQMYCSGYGVARDPQKGRAWINRASRSRSSAWEVGDKPPGYNASDSDSDDMKGDAK
ncbi:uncharacterized protein LOC127807339 [Diospyros lotus]|uniref:uncharacterized protein LOC127807339 n=1 Tax=Diospyros lotus TaxID=55363 RepID=UPI00225BAC63|nr:uncharacterized protein LOC127807339 [Diospyros lotus]XP_052201053.1 uncharacterized protein LOC127807339 [Diospyros lotus]